MNTKHTPGPWYVDPEKLCVRENTVSQMVADCAVGEVKRCLANAALIARAPDLLVVAKDYAAYLQGKRRELGAAEISHLGAIEQLIHKAEGGI